MIGAQQAIVRARCFGALAKVPEQCGGQHVLNQAGLARAADAGDTHQTLQRKINRNVFEVVFFSTFQDEARRVVGHHALEAHAHLLAAAQIIACEGAGIF